MTRPSSLVTRSASRAGSLSGPAGLTVRLLGPLTIQLDGEDVEVAAPKQQAVLAVLASAAGRVVTTDTLIEELWGERPPRSSANTLQTYISRLRRALAPHDHPNGPLHTHATGYELALDAVVVDAERFEATLERARHVRRSSPTTAHGLLVDALRWWRGPALDNLKLGSVLHPQVERLEELHRMATCERLELDVEFGRHTEVLDELATMVAAHPLWERCSELLMTAQYRSGRQADALATYQTTRTNLVAELGVEPGPGLRAVHEAMLAHAPELALMTAAPAAVRSSIGNVPRPLSSLIGRADEVEAVRERLTTDRLVTLMGTGGGGKTRLALAVADTVGDTFADGAWFVELAALDEPELVPRAVLTSMGLRERADRTLVAGLVEQLRARRALIVLDGCEHLISGVADLAERLLSRCPALRILATSRERLRVVGEVVARVRPLPVPAPDAVSAVALEGVCSARLLTERTRASNPDFGVSDDNAPAIARICRTLDGIPLALELAAARVAVLGADEVAERLDDRFGLLVGGSRTASARQRTLRATVDWSYDLLPVEEQTLFTRLSVFAGSFDLEAFGEVVIPPTSRQGEALWLERLDHLVSKSLVLVDHGAERPRYALLDTLRAYGHDRLAGSGDHDALRRQHAAWYASRVHDAQAGLRGPDQGHWRRRLMSDQEDVRAALGWALDTSDRSTALALCSSLWWFWYRSGQVREGYHWLQRAIHLGAGSDATTDRRQAMALARAAHLAWSLGEDADAQADAEESLAFFTTDGDDYGAGEASAVLGLVAMKRGDGQAAEAWLTASLASHRLAGDPWSIAAAAVVLGHHHLVVGETAEADALIKESRSLFAATGDPFGLGWALWATGVLAGRRGDHEASIAHFAESLTLSRSGDHLIGLGLSLIGLGHGAIHTDRPVAAGRLLAAATTVADTIGVPLHLHYGPSYELAVADTHNRLGADRTEQVWAEGLALSIDEACDYALAVARPR